MKRKDIIDSTLVSQIDIRIGQVVSARVFSEARKPAYQLVIDFGAEIGIKNSSAQITELYSVESLPGRMIVAITNLPEKRIAGFVSEVLVLGVADNEGKVVLLSAGGDVRPGATIY